MAAIKHSKTKLNDKTAVGKYWQKYWQGLSIGNLLIQQLRFCGWDNN